MSSAGRSDVGASVKKRVSQFEIHTALQKPQIKVKEYDWDDIETSSSRHLGSGSFSCVHSVNLYDIPCQTFALKQLNLFNSSTPLKQYKRGAIDIALEGKLISYLDHENIIKLHGVKQGCIRDSINNGNDPFFLILDYLPETLEDRLEGWRREGSVSSRLKASLMRQDDKIIHRLETAAIGIARGMEYLHRHGGKSRNIESIHYSW